MRLLVGTYTELPEPDEACGLGIVGCRIVDGALDSVELLARLSNPSYLAPSPDGRVFAVSESLATGGAVTAFAREPGGRLRALGSCPSGGVGPCHVGVAAGGRFLVVAHYGSGTVSAIAAGTTAPGPVTAVVEHAELAAAGQEAHAHMAAVDPVSGLVLVPDLGLDLLLAYRLTERGELVADERACIVFPTGSGPRHVAFHANGRDAFVITERANTLVVLRRSASGLVPWHTTSTLREPIDTNSAAAAVRVAAGGRHVFVTNRTAGGGGVAMLRYDDVAGTTRLVQTAASGGVGPRDCWPLAGGRGLLVANTEGGSLALLAVDEERETIELRSSVAVGSPACVLPG